MIVIARAHCFREGPHFVLVLKKKDQKRLGCCARSESSEQKQKNLTVLPYNSLGICAQFTILLSLKVCRRLL